MIKNLSIKNFKSIKDLNLRTKRINLFIGETNTGKSNILEALGLLNWCNYLSSDLVEYVRLHGIQNLFYNRLLLYLENKDGGTVQLYSKTMGFSADFH